jgi:hypothetical protein
MVLGSLRRALIVLMFSSPNFQNKVNLHCEYGLVLPLKCMIISKLGNKLWFFFNFYCWMLWYQLFSYMWKISPILHLYHTIYGITCIIVSFILFWGICEVILMIKNLMLSLFSTTWLRNKRKIVLLRCCLLISMTNGIKLSFYWGNSKKK